MTLLFTCYFLMTGSLLGPEMPKVETLSVFGNKESLPTRPGSAHVLNQDDLENFGLNDIHRILRQVPGVNIQEEDGYGLRPNIGLRGAHPHRSKGITIMEDGVLIGPSPYAAPAAYYFPQMDKISGVEVFKGTPSTKYGPQSIGGAINLLSRSNPEGLNVGLSGGQFGMQKFGLHGAFPLGGHLSFDINRLSTTGFRELDGGGNTGFVRQNFQTRWEKNFETLDQSLILKINFSDEVSNETYAGLTREDFAQSPLRRYSSTALDKMEWVHRQYMASYSISPTTDLKLNLKGYYHQLERDWFKLNGFYNRGATSPPDIREVLRNPSFSANNYFYQVLSGQANSGVLSDDRDVLDIGNNGRIYASQGLQTQLDYELTGFVPRHLFSFSYRLHSDGVERFHTSSYFNMVDGRLQESSLNQALTARNHSIAHANTLMGSYETQWEKWTTSAILRYEDIQYEQRNFIANSNLRNGEHFLAPGVGIHYQAWDSIGVLAGTHLGFTPTGPGQTSAIAPEEATNYELGLRYTGLFAAEIIGFYSDYNNILGTCTLSSGCDPTQIDERFNGGQAHVAGLEFIADHEFQNGPLRFPLRVSATYTEAYFKSRFSTSVPEWGIGEVRPGDPIPYLPRLQGTLSFGINWKDFFTNVKLNYQSDTADQAVEQDRELIPERWITDLVLGWQIIKGTQLNLRIDNLTNKRYVVSARPFGLRPGLPQSFILGLRHDFF